MVSRNNSSFVRGVVVGCTFSTLLLITSNLVFRGISLSLDSVYGEEVEGLALAEGRSLLFYESKSGSTPSTATSTDGESLIPKSKELPPTILKYFNAIEEERKPLLTVVVTSMNLLERTSSRIRTTWGKDTANYRIVVGALGSEMNTRNIPNVLACAHQDFPAFPYLSISDLTVVLDLIRNNFLGDYKWFLLASSNMYVSVQNLEKFLHGLDADQVTYIGNPSNNTHLCYCKGGPGIVLSSMALRKMEGTIEACAREREGESGYRELGSCMLSRLKTSCYLSDDVSFQMTSCIK